VKKKSIKTTKKKSAKTTKKKSAKTTKSSKTKRKLKKDDAEPDFGIVIVDDDLTVDKEAVMEERRAFLEEARSQEASSD